MNASPRGRVMLGKRRQALNTLPLSSTENQFQAMSEVGHTFDWVNKANAEFNRAKHRRERCKRVEGPAKHEEPTT